MLIPLTSRQCHFKKKFAYLELCASGFNNILHCHTISNLYKCKTFVLVDIKHTLYTQKTILLTSHKKSNIFPFFLPNTQHG